jgi:hypothetical protein
MSQTRSLACGGPPRTNGGDAISIFARLTGVQEIDFQAACWRYSATKSLIGTCVWHCAIDRSSAGDTTVVQIFPVGQRQEGPQHDMSGCDEAAATGQASAADGAAMSETAIKTWQN